MVPSKASERRGRLAAWLLIVFLVVVSLAVVLIPVWLIQPFKPQTGRGLELSYLLRRWAPAVTVFASAAVLALVLWSWRETARWWGKMGLIVFVAMTFLPLWFARQNHFEWMFKPLSAPAYARTQEAGFVSDADKVIAIQLNAEAAAYPVRQLAYHHVVPDVVGGVPLVVTY
jgi:hypothetical protein